MCGLGGSFIYAIVVADPRGCGPSISDIAGIYMGIVLISTIIGLVVLVATVIYWLTRKHMNSPESELIEIKFKVAILLPLVFFLVSFLIMTILVSKSLAPPRLEPLSLNIPFLPYPYQVKSLTRYGNLLI